MHPEQVMTDTERKQLAQIADLKAANSRSQSAATITLQTTLKLLTKELTSTREALEDANTAKTLLSKELYRALEQIADLECTVKIATETANQAAEARLKPMIELENVENEKAKIEANALGDHVEWR
jgi:hypothetical protein